MKSLMSLFIKHKITLHPHARSLSSIATSYFGLVVQFGAFNCGLDDKYLIQINITEDNRTTLMGLVSMAHRQHEFSKMLDFSAFGVRYAGG